MRFAVYTNDQVTTYYDGGYRIDPTTAVLTITSGESPRIQIASGRWLEVHDLPDLPEGTGDTLEQLRARIALKQAKSD